MVTFLSRTRQKHPRSNRFSPPLPRVIEPEYPISNKESSFRVFRGSSSGKMGLGKIKTHPQFVHPINEQDEARVLN